MALLTLLQMFTGNVGGEFEMKQRPVGSQTSSLRSGEFSQTHDVTHGLTEPMSNFKNAISLLV